MVSVGVGEGGRLSPEDAREILAALEEADLLSPVLDRLDETLSLCRLKLVALNLGVQPVPEEDSYRLFRLSLM